jgi:hypothetical protein
MKLSCLSAVKRPILIIPTIDGSLVGGRPEPAAPYVDAAAVLDRSGSMLDLLPGARAGVKIWLEKQKQTKNCYVEVVTFDTVVEKPYVGYASMMMRRDMDNCLSALKARGMTRLYDTAVETIHRQMKRLAAWRSGLPKARMLTCLDMKPVSVLFVLTDGQDNESAVADAAAFKRALALTKRDWGTLTIFAAANQDAMAAGQAYGFNPQTILQMDASPAAVTSVFRSAVASQGRAVSGAPPRMTAMERLTSAPNHHQQSAPPVLGGAHNSLDDDDDGGGGALPLVPPTPPRRAAFNYILPNGGGRRGTPAGRAHFMSPMPVPTRPPLLRRSIAVGSAAMLTSPPPLLRRSIAVGSAAILARGRS